MESAEMGRRPAQTEEMLPLLRRHEIQVLLRAGHSQKDVAARTGASADTVQRVKREAAVSETDDAAERRSRRRAGLVKARCDCLLFCGPCATAGSAAKDC